MTTLHIFWTLYGDATIVLGGWILCAGIGLWQGYGWGKDSGYDVGLDRGIEVGYDAGKSSRQHRDASGRFTK